VGHSRGGIILIGHRQGLLLPLVERRHRALDEDRSKFASGSLGEERGVGKRASYERINEGSTLGEGYQVTSGNMVFGIA